MAAKKQAPAERKLVAYVYVDGVCYGPDSEVPAEVALQVAQVAGHDDARHHHSSGRRAPTTGRRSAVV